MEKNHKKRSSLVENIVLFLVSVIGVRLAATDSPAYRFFAGVFVGTYAMAGTSATHVVVTHVGHWWRNGRRIQSNILKAFVRSANAFAIVIFILSGIFAWVTGWEGNTHIAYGFGVFLSAWAYTRGVGQYVDETMIAPSAAMPVKMGGNLLEIPCGASDEEVSRLVTEKLSAVRDEPLVVVRARS